jgi:hypothetical protein
VRQVTAASQDVKAARPGICCDRYLLSASENSRSYAVDSCHPNWTSTYVDWSSGRRYANIQ